MATNIHAGRCYEQSQVHYLYGDLAFNQAEPVVSLGWMPEDGIIHAIYVVTTTAFNGGTLNQVDVGYRNRGDGVADDPDGFASNVTIAAAGSVVPSLATTANLGFPQGGEVTATPEVTGTAPTAGAARVVVEYTVATDAP